MPITDLVSLHNAAHGFTSVLVVAVVAAEFENSGLLGLYWSLSFVFFSWKLKADFQKLQQVLESLKNASFESQLNRFMLYASRPRSEFNSYEASGMIKAIQRCAHDNKAEKQAYYRLVYQTARDKLSLPTLPFRSLLLRLLGDTCSFNYYSLF